MGDSFGFSFCAVYATCYSLASIDRLFQELYQQTYEGKYYTYNPTRSFSYFKIALGIIYLQLGLGPFISDNLV